MSFQDTFKHKGMRKQLIAELRKDERITNEAIFDAFYAVPRHFFLDVAFVEQAYSNKAFQIGAGQTISHPITVAFQTQLLEVKKGDKILEIGTGSGFQTSILCEMGAKVYSIERQKELYLNAKKIFDHFHYNPKVQYGDGYKGMPAYAPFDKIIVTCGAPEVPQALIDQLKVGGILVIPVGEGSEQTMKRLIKTSDGDLEVIEYGTFKFVPMLEKTAR
ncbi:MAG: protein-L-isoaspartate(D-aspartate) O-methyltransferase [Bacteroidetes bacterium]|nr:MAG: protein-L-isoaspartate(D-aspartate) O-methyltransferase [Bacteroidota bacterium]